LQIERIAVILSPFSYLVNKPGIPVAGTAIVDTIKIIVKAKTIIDYRFNFFMYRFASANPHTPPIVDHIAAQRP